MIETARLPIADIRSALSEAKFRLLVASCAGLVLLWFAPAAVWVAMPAWLVLAAALHVRARSDDWLALPLAGLPFWWATGLAQFAIPALAGAGVIGAMLAPPISRRVREAWDTLGVEKWLAVAAFASMLPSVLVVSGAGRMFTYVRTVGLIGVSLAAFLAVNAYARRNDVRRLVWFVVAFAGAFGLWTLAQLVYRGSIHLPLQRTASVLEWLPGRAGRLASRAVAEAAGIKYENVGGGRLVVRPHAFFVHAVVTGAMAGLLGPLLWRRIAHLPVWRALASALFAGLIATALASSLARGAYLGVLIAIPGAVVAFWPRLRRLDWRRVAPSIAIGVAVAALVVISRGQEVQARNSSKLAEGSFVSRAAYYTATLEKTFEYPLFGHGTQRDNVAAPLQVPKGTRIVRIPASTTEHAWGDATSIFFQRVFPDGRMERHVYDRANGRLRSRSATTERPPANATSETVETVAEEAVVSNADNGIIVVQKLKGGRQERHYYGPSVPPGAPAGYRPPPDAPIVQRAKLISSADRDPPLGSHSTLLGVSYKYGLVGSAAFAALWFFIGLRPLKRLRTEGQPMFDDARAIWIGILAFGAQFLIYEYDFDSASPYLFYLLGGILLGMTARPEPGQAAPSPAGRTTSAAAAAPRA